ncbi:MAG: hypothetical protein F9K30_07740 [Dechloromonas sp.]|nr:MAG: hypothetical protein F9K30_07740 [Dechloromonas sp.]
MTDNEFEQFLKSALAELWEKQDRLESEHGFASYSRWFFDQQTEKLEMFDAKDQKAVVADVIDIGSYASNSNTWKWAWSNDSVLPSLREKSESLKALADLTGIGLFTSEEAFSVENEHMAWELVAMSVRHLNAIGAYKAPSSSRPLSTFLAITGIRHL